MGIRLAIILLLSGAIASAVAAPGDRLAVGTASAWVADLAAGVSGGRLEFALHTPAGERLPLAADATWAGGGKVSLSGKVRGRPESEFILKGGKDGVYAWVVHKDSRTAYEYTTDAIGTVTVEEVPLDKIMPVCDLPDVPEPSGRMAAEATGLTDLTGPEPHIGPYPGAGTSVRKLQSLPGSKKVIYMDISRIMDGETPKGWTKAQVWEIWQGFAAGLSMFDVNVTTDPAVYAAAGVANSGKAILHDETGNSTCVIEGFGSSMACNVYRKETAKYNAGTLIHEMGHLLGLSHDGNPKDAYFEGFSAFQWCPVMGSHPSALKWANTLWQWSRGEYAGASEKQDDLSIINRHLDYRADDIRGRKALVLSGTSVTAALNRGQIARNTDVDTFSFQVGPAGGRARLRVDRTEYAGGSMLDVEAWIVDTAGKEAARDNKVGARGAELDVSLPAGRYLLCVRGGAEGTAANGFSRYSSLGFYAIEGDIGGGVVGLAEASSAAASASVPRLAADGLLRLAPLRGRSLLGAEILALDGRRVFAASGPVESIDMRRFPRGSYHLRLVTGDGVEVRRIAKL